METGQDASEAARRAYTSPTTDSVLFINMANQSQASQASSRKKARSHIMTRYHRRARKLRVSEQCGRHTSYDNP